MLSADRTRLTPFADYRSGEQDAALGVAISLDDSPEIQTFLEGAEPLLAEHAQTDSRLSVIREVLKRRATASLMVMPVRMYDRTIGTLNVETETPRRFTSAEVALAQQVARIAGQSLQNARLYSLLQEELAERKHAEQSIRALNEELAKARDQALEASRLKSEFLATMSHEIRTPLNAIIGMTELLVNTPLNAEQRDYATITRDASQSLLNIINDILDFSKIEAGRMVLESFNFQMNSVLEGAAEMFAGKARQKNLSLMTFIDPAIPRPLRGDPARVRQILVNLIDNAVKFTERGEIVARAALESPSNGSTVVRFTVSDSGIGIPPAARERIFQPFTQADGSMTRKYSGTGLGLAICKHLVTLMGGEIGVDSEEGKGSTFWFTARFERPPARDLPARSTTHADLSKVKVLVVSDSQTHREIFFRYLNSWHIKNDQAADTAEALSLLQRATAINTPYDVVILDIATPAESSLTLARAIQADPAHASTRLILITSSDSPASDAESRQPGFAAYLPKPVKQSHLFDAIANAVVAQPSGREEANGFSRRLVPQAVAPTLTQTGALRMGRLILLVEDNLANQKLALAQLHKLDYVAQAVGNGLEALRAVETMIVAGRTYGLILMDCQMPEMDGFEATRAIRKAEISSGRRIPIIAMTANAMEGDRENCLAAGMDDYISKPVSLELLRSVLERWMPSAPSIPEGRKGATSAVVSPLRQVRIPEQTTETPPAQASGAINRLPPPLDATALEALRALQTEDDPHFLSGLIDIYLNDTASLIRTMHQAIEQGDTTALRYASHRMKGSSANFGARELASYCSKIESLARDGFTRGRVPPPL